MINKSSKIITFILIVAMIMSAFASFSIVGIGADTQNGDTTVYPAYTTENGSVVVEIENVIIDPTQAILENVKEASGRKQVKFMSTTTTHTIQPTPDAPGMAGFELTFDKPGKYAFYLRFVAPGPDTVWLDYGGEAYRTKTSGYEKITFNVSKDKQDYQWKRVGTLQVLDGEEGKKVTVRLRTREQGFITDKFIITNVSGYTPEGTGKKPDPSSAYTPQKMPEDRYPIPTITPPPEHPRVLFRASDIPQIKENMKDPEVAELVKIFETLKEREYTGDLAPKDPNYDAEGLEVIVAKALDYAFYGNEENGKKAIEAIKNYAGSLDVTTQGDKCRQIGHVVKVAGQVYDWCHPLLSSKDKAQLMALVQSLSADMEVGFPPDVQSILCGHGAEHQLYRDWLTMAIACYDEYPDAYNLVAGKIFSPESVEYRNWWNKSGTHSQGTAYAVNIRYKSELYAHTLIKKMCGAELFNEEDLTNIAYEWIYRRRPDGLLMIDGDDTYANTVSHDTYLKKAKDIMFLSAMISKDPVIKRQFLYEGGYSPMYSREALQPIDMLLLNDPSIASDVAIDTLPLTAYHASPVGEMVARTGWNLGTKSDDVVATMTITEYNGMNHAHYDSGHFMIYYKGILANDSGWYEKHNSTHHNSYMSQSVAHNTLIIETEKNKYGNQNQGIEGQGVETSSGKNFYWNPTTWKEYQTDEQNRFAEIIAHEFGPDTQYPQYSYLAGDIANAYTSDYDDGVNEALRHMIFMPTGDEKNPAVFVVFDKIDTKVGGKKKAFMLHSQEEPEVSGNVTTIKRTEKDFNGKLVNQTLLPTADNLSIEKIGGAEYDADGKLVAGTDKRFWNKEQNWSFLQDIGLATGANDGDRTVKDGMALEAGWGRVEIMPKKTNKVDYLLNVMYVGDAGDNTALQKATLIETEGFAGTKIFDRVVMFNKNKARTKDDVTFKVPGDETELKVNVTGLLAGTWNISVNGESITTQIVSEDGGIIYFTAPAGEYKITYANADANKQFEKSAPPQVEGVTIFFGDNFLYSDVPATIIDGRTLIPMRALLEAMKAEVTWDEQNATATATSDDGAVTISITENSKIAYVDGEPVELDVPAMIIDGRFVIPVRFISENFGAKVTWNEAAQMVSIKSSRIAQKELGIPNYIRIADAIQSGSEATEGRQIPASFDGKMSTYWGVSSENNAEVWGIYDFGQVKTVDKVMLSFMKGTVRKYKFDIEVSEDGVNYTTVLKDMETSGMFDQGELEPFDLGGVRARYVRYRGYGNSVNAWNSLVEIVFTQKK